VTRTQRLTLIATILGSTIVFLDATVVSVALPAISDDLNTGLADQQWVVEAYLLAMVSLLMVGGSLGDQYGRRRLYVIGLAGFGATSVLCGIAPTPELLIAGRALQGIAGALLVPGSLAILAATFEGTARGRAIGSWTAWSGIATVVGPAGGGLLVVALSWRWIFLVNVPLVLGTLYLVRHAVEESFDPEAPQGVDLGGILLSAAGLAGPVFALIEQPTRGWGDPLVWGPLAAGAACLVAFVVYEGRIARPLMPLWLFRIRNFAAANLSTLSVYAGLMGGSFFLALYLQQVAGYSALGAGFATVPVSLLLFILSPRFGAVTARIGPRLPMALGPIVGGAGLLLLMRVGFEPDYPGEVLPGLLVFGTGLAATVAPLTTTVLDSVEPSHAGVASGINNDVSRIAGLLAIAVLGAVITANFTSEVDGALAARTLTPAQERTVADARTRPLASAESRGIRPGDRAVIGAAIDDAAVSAFHLALGLSGALMIAGGLIAAAGIRNPERAPAPRPAPRAATACDCGHCAEEGRGHMAAPFEPAKARL
jgi:EmrB/QacA subfamily drug resistance transporter